MHNQKKNLGQTQTPESPIGNAGAERSLGISANSIVSTAQAQSSS